MLQMRRSNNASAGSRTNQELVKKNSAPVSARRRNSLEEAENEVKHMFTVWQEQGAQLTFEWNICHSLNRMSVINSSLSLTHELSSDAVASRWFNSFDGYTCRLWIIELGDTGGHRKLNEGCRQLLIRPARPWGRSNNARPVNNKHSTRPPGPQCH